MNQQAQDQWQFWVDRGGTFTDLVAKSPTGELLSHKLLSENPSQYKDAAVQGIRDMLGLNGEQVIPTAQIHSVKMGTTVATNALLERAGEDTLLVTTKGFKDALKIGYQMRPNLFAMDIQLPDVVFAEAIEIDERVNAHGEVLTAPDLARVREQLQAVQARGFKSIAIVFVHGYRYTEHEAAVAKIARELAFPQVSVSHETSPLMKMVSRGDTTVVDAYLSPILRRYVDQVAGQLVGLQEHGGRLMFMRSNGGLTDARFFQGKDAILSGPAGGVVGMVQTAARAGLDKLIGFDMGGTSTDVCHYRGEYERTYETQVAGVRLRAPMMLIHTIAAGGSSLVNFDGSRYRVGPRSAGSFPGPACYRNHGDLALTDCNVMLGKLQADLFPQVFGENGDQPLDKKAVQDAFITLADDIAKASGQRPSAESIASGFLQIAVENMANAIKKISVQRGYDVSEYTLCCFGGAGGQHACLVADALGMNQIFIHPFAGVLSAFGMGLADTTVDAQSTIEATLNADVLPELAARIAELEAQCRDKLILQLGEVAMEFRRKLHLRYANTDSTLEVDYLDLNEMQQAFENQHRGRFGFIYPDREVMVESIAVEAIHRTDVSAETQGAAMTTAATPQYFDCYMADAWHNTPFLAREQMTLNQAVNGPAVIYDETGTTVVEPGWQALRNERDELLLKRYLARPASSAVGATVDPVMLEIFNNLFMSIAEQMGFVLENTAVSVNIKERLDFSCAIFDARGDLVANAPHMPVHLGSMSESIKTVITAHGDSLVDGDAYILNAPYNGGTHLPDITIIKPVFSKDNELLFYVASRGHHADIGGITPGSMPANSTSIDEEGVVFNNMQLMSRGVLLEDELREHLNSGEWPARSPDLNVADLKAQLAACEKGAQELLKMIDYYGNDTVQAYMRHVQDNAEEEVRRVLDRLSDGEFCYPMDDGSQIKVAITVDNESRSARVDFSGTSAQHPGNFNAPQAVVRAAVLYVFRCLVDGDIPLNEGCLKPMEIIIPEGSMISPQHPAAVIAGNVETSQCLVDTLFGAVQVMGAAQGTMNNTIWGNERYQYYETVCGGAGATAKRAGASAVHTHMTNSKLTDPEVLEWRFPVHLVEFSIRENSGGKGKYDGGDGVMRRTRFLEAMNLNILSGHRQVPTYGVDGGGQGQVGRNRVVHHDGRVSELPGVAQIFVEPGDELILETPGGGGFGKID